MSIDTDKMIWRFVNVKRMVKEIAEHEGRFFESGKFSYNDFLEESRQELMDSEVPDYDEQNPDALTFYFVLASALYLIYDLFSLKTACFVKKRDELAGKLKECIAKIKFSSEIADSLAADFEILDTEEQKDTGDRKPCKWLHHDDVWLDGRLQTFKKFVDTREIPETDFPCFLWLFLKSFGHSLPASLENGYLVYERPLDSLAAYCAYACNESRLFENINNYSLNLFAQVKKMGWNFEKGLVKVNGCGYRPIDVALKMLYLEQIKEFQKEAEASGTDFETVMDSYRKFGWVPSELEREKYNLLTTIKDNDELVDMVMYHNFVKSSPKRCDFLNNSILELVKKVFDREEVGKDVLLPAMQCILDQDVEILKTQPYLVMLCYLAIHYLEEEELLYLFKKSVKEGASGQEESCDAGIAGTLVFRDIKECPNLQLLFFFTLFDMCISGRQKKTEICDEFLAALKEGDWFEPSMQSSLLTSVLKINGVDCSISEDDMTFERYIDKRFPATKSVLNLVYNVACYSGKMTIENIVQQIDNIGEHRSVLMYSKVQATFDDAQKMKKKSRSKKQEKEFYADFTDDEQKMLRAESNKMKEIDCGFVIPKYTQLIPGRNNRFFSRNFEIKLFLKSDVSCVPPDPKCDWLRKKYYLERNKKMMACGYLYHDRNMKRHNTHLDKTDSLLDPYNYPDLLRILFETKMQLQKDCSLPKDKENECLFKFHSGDVYMGGVVDVSDLCFFGSVTHFWMQETGELIEKRNEAELLDNLKFYEGYVNSGNLDKDSDAPTIEMFKYLAGLKQKVKGKFSSNVETAAVKVSDIAESKIEAMRSSYDAVSYDLFKNEPNYGSPFLKKCISLLLQVIQCVTSVEGVVDELKKPSEFNESGEQRPLLTAAGDVTFEGKRDEVEYPESLKKELRLFLDTVFGVESLRQSEKDPINRNVFHLYGHKIMLYLMKVTLQMTRLDVRELHKVQG
jgi:hypothetical protein